MNLRNVKSNRAIFRTNKERPIDYVFKKKPIYRNITVLEGEEEEIPDDPTSGNTTGTTTGDTPNPPITGNTSGTTTGDTPNPPMTGVTPNPPTTGTTTGDTPNPPMTGVTPNPPTTGTTTGSTTDSIGYLTDEKTIIINNEKLSKYSLRYLDKDLKEIEDTGEICFVNNNNITYK